MRHNLLDATPLDKIDTIAVQKRLPRPATAADVQKVFATLCPRRPRKDPPLDRLRDRLLFETAYVRSARAGYTTGPLFRASVNGASDIDINRGKAVDSGMAGARRRRE